MVSRGNVADTGKRAETGAASQVCEVCKDPSTETSPPFILRSWNGASKKGGGGGGEIADRR